MPLIDEREQWKLGGDCNKCRRKEYCNKSCTANKKRVKRRAEAQVERLVGSVLYRMFGGRYGD